MPVNPSPAAIAATNELERTLGGTGWPNTLKNQIAHTIDQFMSLRIAEKDDCEPTRIQLNADGTWNTLD